MMTLSRTLAGSRVIEGGISVRSQSGPARDFRFMDWLADGVASPSVVILLDLFALCFTFLALCFGIARPALV